MSVNHPEENVVSGLYENYFETQKEILTIETRKTRNKLIYVATTIFVFDFLAVMIVNAFILQTLLWISVVPLIILALAFFALKEPMAAMIVASLLIAGIWVYSIIITGGLAAISGWIGKAIIIYLLIAGFQSAREATKIKGELKGAP